MSAAVIKCENVYKIFGANAQKMLKEANGNVDAKTFQENGCIVGVNDASFEVSKGEMLVVMGLSGSGKSTLANGLLVKLLELGGRSVTLLDGDLVRNHLSSELGFSKRHRSLNVQRIGFVASEITKNRGIAICAPIAPYEHDRNQNRKLISKFGGYIEVYVNTSLKKCEERDSKGLYKLARKGQIEQFTGISDPYEDPINADIIINSDGSKTPVNLVNIIYEKIKQKGYV